MLFSFLLFIVTIVFLVVIKTSIESKFYDLNFQIRVLTKLVESLKAGGVALEKEVVKPIDNIKKEVKIDAPNLDLHEFVPIVEIVEEQKSIVPKIVFEAPKPIVEIKKPTAKPTKPSKSFWANFKEKNPDLEKFIGEDLISKIGILILVLGISYFVKYSIDKGWISEPARVGIGILAGSLVLGVAHKLREKFAAFSSVFVAGAIAIFYFTIAIAFHDYKLFGQEVAFAIMVLITGFAAVITVFYNRLELGILTLIGGFAVPFMVSTGAGNYAILFSYILILDVGILAIAYFKKWDVLNLLAFIFTSLLFGSWLFQEVSAAKPHYVGGLFFAFLFYVLFCVINIINTLKVRGEFSKLQMGVIASNTFLFYCFGMAILNHFHPEFRGLFTTAVGIFNLVYAYFIFKKFGADKRVLYLLIGLTLTFITLAVPVQFNGHYITMFWAIEAVMLLWLSQKANVASYKLCAIIVHGLMLFSLILDWHNFYNGTETLTVVANPIFITGLIAIASYFMMVFLLKKETQSQSILRVNFNPIFYAKIQFILGVVVAYFVGLLEVAYQASTYINLQVSGQSVVWFYHLLFTAILCFLLIKNQFKQTVLIASIALFNIFAFMFLVSGQAFSEHKNYISTAILCRVAFYMHYFSLILTLYFGYIVIKLYRNQQLSNFFYKPIFLWLAAFFVVYAASTELLIHGLVLSNEPVSMVYVQKQFPNGLVKDQISWMRTDMAVQKIESMRTTIFKSGIPVLWGVIAFLFLIFGIRKQSRILRIMALSLLGITILKLFLYDIRNASETGRIIAFILLGVLILIISFVYQKLKVLVAADDKPKNEPKNE